VTLAGAVALAGSRQAWAQPAPPVARGDAAGTIGWLSANKGLTGQPPEGDWHDALFGAVSAGWYWTDYLKTELDFGAGTKSTAYRSQAIVFDGRQTYAATITTFSRRTLGISQQYQFFHNVWFHPHLAVGANITRELLTEHNQPIYLYDESSRTSRIVAPVRTDVSRTATTVRPFVATGFKAYMTRRGFFRSDVRIAFRGGIDEVLLRFGFGIDF
jgi:hypothetical protein